MQTWVWDYVPLSGTKAEGNDKDVQVNDYLVQNYIGDLQVEITNSLGRDYGQDMGTYKYVFNAEFGDWRLTAYNMA